jgi:hypothetical protein
MRTLRQIIEDILRKHIEDACAELADVLEDELDVGVGPHERATGPNETKELIMTDTRVFRDMATLLRSHNGLVRTQLKYTKGVWRLGRDGVEANGSQFGTRPDWLLRGWSKWQGQQLADLRVGYVADGYQPPARAELGDLDETEWAIWSKGRDPWGEQLHLPLFNAVSNEQMLWSTFTEGGKKAIATLLIAYADRCDAQPADGKVLPVVLLGSDTYPHRNFGDIACPTLNIVGWAVPPATPRPPLPTAPPAPRAIEAPVQEEIPLRSAAQEMMDEIPF